MREAIFAVLGFATASIIPAAFLASIFPLSGNVDGLSIVGSFVVLYPYSLAAVVVLGVPAFALLRPYRPGNWWSVTAVGLALGLLVALVLRLPAFPEFRDAAMMAPLGAASALAFWLVWRQGTAAKPRPPL
jgi:hypothetical protein